jgi:ssDNA-specific exonuclease RecJ
MNIYNKTYLAILSFFFSLFILLNFSSCDDGPTEPNVEPGSRDYTWEVDTLNIPFTYLHRIWGTSPNDVWVIGPGGDLDKTIYHYNGEEWSNDGVSRAISPFSIWGFGSNEVWLGGLEGRIWHFNGLEWRESFILENTNINFSGFMDIYGKSRDDVYAVGFIDSTDGRKGMIAHYNGFEWKRLNILNTRSNFTRIKKAEKTSRNFFIRGLVESESVEDTTKIFMLNGNNLVQIYSAIDVKENTNFIQNINNEMIFVIGYTLNKFNENKFEKFYDINDNNFGIQIFGRNIKDTFVRMEDGIAHFNGSDIQYLIKTNDNKPSEGIVFDETVFFLSNNFNNGLNMIYRGIKK